MTGLDVLFAGFALLTAVAGLLAVTSQLVVRAALWLVVALGGLAGCYLLLGAEVVALVQLLVYVGAVVVLVLFALMLTRAPTGPPGDSQPGSGVPARTHDADQPWVQKLAAAVAGVAVAALLGGTLLHALGGEVADTGGGRGRAQDLGEVLFGSWVLPFELLSVLLLAALVAALVLSSPTADGTGETDRTGADAGAGVGPR